jgi:penicillin G amidase
MRFVLRVVVALVVLGLTTAAFFVADVWIGMHAHARTSGTVDGLAVRAPVRILRDDRGIPHVIAANEHDLFFAEGYVEGSDRLFQMDLLRRYVKGELAEVFGSAALPSDVKQRAVPIRRMVDAQWAGLNVRARETLGAFSDGVNAAIAREPLPVEFRMLGYKPLPWEPEDSMAVSMATVLDLIDDWNAILPRDRAYGNGGLAALDAAFPLSDPCYDAPVLAGLAGIGPGAPCTSRAALLRELNDPRTPIGSNEWAAGANRTVSGRALLANDPHLGLQMPGVWYLIDLRAPGFHAAGATFPGAPGVVLGHNDHVAWAATDGSVASLSVFRPATLDANAWENETIHVRYGRDVTQRYYRSAREFGVTLLDGQFVLVRWNAYDRPQGPQETFLDLDGADSIDAALAIFAKYPGPTMNFALADTSGRAAYVLAGEIPSDPAWSRWFHPAADLARSYPPIARPLLPHVAPSRDAVVWTANNKLYAGAGALRLSPQFAPPYRAYRIAQLLRARAKYDVAYFTAMQMDSTSLPERELAGWMAKAFSTSDAALSQALAAWNGRMDGDSLVATTVEGLRVQLTDHHAPRIMALLAQTRHSAKMLGATPIGTPVPWSVAGADPVPHAFASLGINFLNGITLPGNGDAYTIHMQAPGTSQSFRAVWDVGNWDAGGIALPEGESGQPGSPHYVDQVPDWVAGRLTPLPYSEAAVERAAAEREILAP